MTTLDITLSDNKNKFEDFAIPAIDLSRLRIQSLNVIYNFLQGTDSNEWLKDAEDMNNG